MLFKENKSVFTVKNHTYIQMHDVVKFSFFCVTADSGAHGGAVG
jgi:hypothetical protein